MRDEGKINKCPDFFNSLKRHFYLFTTTELLHSFCQVVKKIKVFIPEIFMFHKGSFK